MRVEGQTSRVGREGLEETKYTSVSAARPDRRDSRRSERDYKEDVRIDIRDERRPRDRFERVEIREQER